MTWLVTTGLTSAVVAVFLAGAAYTIGRWAKRPALTHVLWVLVLIKLLTPPMFEVPLGWRIDPAIFGAAPPVAAMTPAPPPIRPVPATEVCIAAPALTSAVCEDVSRTPVPPPTPAASAPRAPAWLLLLTTPANWLRAAVVVWMLGSASMALLFFWRMTRFQRYLRLAARADGELQSRLAELARDARLTSHPQIVTVESTISPMLFGLGRGTLLVFPAALNRQLAPAARDTLLLHELAHFARGDHWVRLVELLAQMVFWWHPVVWWARRELEAAEEECCDAWVVERHAGVPRIYAEALLAAIDFLCEAPATLPPAACGLGEVPLLRARLTQIVRGRLAAQLCPATKTAVFLAAMLVLPVFPSLFGAAVVAAPRAVLSVAREPVTPEPVMAQPDSPEPATASSPAEAALQDMSPTVAAVAAAFPRPRRTSAFWATAVSPDGRFKVEVREGYQATLLQTSGANQPVREPLSLAKPLAKCVSFAPDSKSFAAGNDNCHVSIYDSLTGVLNETLKGASAPILTVSYSPDGRRLAAGAADGSVIVWDLLAGDFSTVLGPRGVPAICVRWTRDSQQLAVSLGDDIAAPEAATLVICSVDQGVVLRQFSLTNAAGAIDWLDGDQKLLIADYRGEATIRLAASGLVVSQRQLDQTAVSAAQWSPEADQLPDLVARVAP